MPSLIGNKPNQVPTNGDLGRLAYMDNLDSFTSKTVMDTDITNIAPSLNLDFANSKVLDPRITFTRASTATFYNGISSAVAEQNLLVYSQDYTQSAWQKQNLTNTANSTTSPDGTTTASTLTASAGSAFHILNSFPATNIGTGTYTVSAYLKAGTSNFCSLNVFTSAGGWCTATFNLSTVAVTQTTGTVAFVYVGATITSVGSSWYRVTLTFTSTVTTVQASVAINSSATPTLGSFGLETWTALGTETIQVWGAQLEQRSAATAYTPTTTAAITNYIPTLSTASAGVARFDHNPITGESLGLLIEEQRVNLATYSDDFSNAAWTKNASATISSNSIVAPDGTLTGDKLVSANSTNSFAVYNYAMATLAASTYTFSCYAKAGEATWFSMLLYQGTGGNHPTAYYNLSNGTLGTVSGASASATITPVGNGWYRCTLTGTTQALSGGGALYIASGNGSTSYVGNGFAGLFIWGAQLEAGSFATSYIPTVASQVTKIADNPLITGTNFSSWYNSKEWTVYVEADSYAPNSANLPLFSISDGGAVSNKINVDTGTNLRTFNYSNSVNNYGLTNLATASNNTMFKVITAVAANDVAATANGNAVKTTSAMSLMPQNISRLALFDETGNLRLNGHMKKLTYYPRRLPNSELVEMTA